MSAQILDGKLLAKTLTEHLQARVAQLKAQTGQAPRMVNVVVGSDHSASAYTNSQKRLAEKIGIEYQLRELPADISQDQLQGQLRALSSDPSVHGVMLHKPVPAQIDFRRAIQCLDPDKDVEGVNANNLGKLLLGESSIVPCTPAAVMELLKIVPDFSLRGKEAVVVGRSEIVGKPVALLLLSQSATVSVCHSGTSDAGQLRAHLARAEIVVVAMGKANFIKGEWIKNGAVVIDVGINQSGDKLVGDVEYEAARERAAYITPVPGGVGPVTVVCLMQNAVAAFCRQKNLGS